MRKYHSHTLLYLHETIALGSGRSDRFTEVFTDVYQPMMTELGARLFAIWESTPYNGHWPQVTIIWEIDSFADYARIGKAQARGGSHQAPAAKWSTFMAEIGASGEGRIMYPGPSNKTLAQLREANFSAGLVIQEIMQTKPGRQDDYIRELERLYVPWSERTGKHWLGSFTTTFRFNEVIHYWALEGDWECFAEHYPSWKESPPAEIVTWMSVGARPARRLGRLHPAGPTTIPTPMTSTVQQDFSYDPFAPAVMADPLPYYRVLRDPPSAVLHPEMGHVRAVPLLRHLAGVWNATTGHSSLLRARCPLQPSWLQHNDGPVPDPLLHPMPFHANFDAPLYESVRRCTSAPFRPKSVSNWRPDSHSGQRAPR